MIRFRHQESQGPVRSENAMEPAPSCVESIQTSRMVESLNQGWTNRILKYRAYKKKENKMARCQSGDFASRVPRAHGFLEQI